MTPHGEWLAPERFDFSRIGRDWAVVRLLAQLEPALSPATYAGLCAAGSAQLVIHRGDDDALLYPARACRLERRLPGDAGRGRGVDGGQLLWRAAFAVPLTVVEAAGAAFELTADGHVAVALPAPRLRVVRRRALSIAPPRDSPRITAGPSRRLAALATAFVLTGTSSPAVALAAGISGAGSSTAKVQGAGSSTAKVRGGSTQTGSGGAAPVTTTTKSEGSVPAPPPVSPTPTTPVVPIHPKKPVDRAPRRSRAHIHVTSSPAPSATSGPSRNRSGAIAATPTPAKPPTTTCRSATHKGAVAIIPAAPAAPAAPAVASAVPAIPAVTDRGATRAIGLKPGTQAGCSTPTAPRRPKQSRSGKHPRSGEHPKHHARTGTHPTHRPPVASSHPGPSRTPTTRPSGGAPVAASGPAAGTRARHPTATAPTGGTAVGGTVPTLSPTPAGTLAPVAWTGTVTADPSLTGAVRNLAGLLANGDRPPSFLIPIYMQAGKRYGVPWPVLAAINAIESDYGRDLSTSTAGAVGWMQFEPATWREWGVAADGHRVANPYDPRDAIFSAARYLKAAGAAQSVSKAVFAYNHAGWYVDEVLSRAQAIAHHAQYEKLKVNKRGTFSVFFATGIKRHPRVRYSGGVLSHYDRLIASANMVSAANFPYLYGGGHEQPARFGPFDCSGSVSYVIQQAGYKVPTTVSGDIPIWKFPAGPGRVTIFYNPVHTYMRIGSRFFGTSGFARPGGGAGWFDVDKLPAGYLAQFREVHVPRLGTNSFAPPRHRRARRA